MDEILDSIAIIGMSGRFPGAKNIEQFWQNLRDGIEGISFFSREELKSAGVPNELLDDSRYVPAWGTTEDVDLFDASFFGYSPREAEIMDPQYRVFLECAWEAFESSGYDTERYQGRVGVYAGAGFSTYLLNPNTPTEILNSLGDLWVRLGNDRDFLSTMVSYKLNLKGPSINIQTACSTSLVAVHLACQSLLNYQCDMALAGGSGIRGVNRSGYMYTGEGVMSPDGHCRAFDAKAGGTVGGDGAGVVVLKRLSDAIEDRDTIYALIRGSQVNNDGSVKVGYTAPGVNGQAEVIALAQSVAGVVPEDITYVETHGSGTSVGDPIEVKALSRAFRMGTQKNNFCAIGSVKTNVGHLGPAAGIAGLIKTVMSLKHRMIPPSLHFEEPNPQIEFAGTPFYVNAKLTEWKGDRPLRAGVSSFGIGGTNAHLILEEYVAPPTGEIKNDWCLLTLSARSEAALDSARLNLANHLKANPETRLVDVAYTLHAGRQKFRHRWTTVSRTVEDAINAMEGRLAENVSSGEPIADNPPVVFMFPGVGEQYLDMARGLYDEQPLFRTELDRCFDYLNSTLGLDLRSVVFSADRPANDAPGDGQRFNLRAMLGRDAVNETALNKTSISQPLTFAIEYALARLLIGLGVRPMALIGYSLGEFVAACVAGVLSLEDSLTLVAKRALLIDGLASGAMLTVALTEEELRPLLTGGLCIAVSNSPMSRVVAGPVAEVENLEGRLVQEGVACRRVKTMHAFHSQMIAAAVEPFTEMVRAVTLRPPQIPYISNVTGTWITDDQAIDPTYWSRHMCATVRFEEGIAALLKQYRVFIEVGPGQSLSAFAGQARAQDEAPPLFVPCLKYSYDQQPDMAFFVSGIAKLWLAGVDVDISKFTGGSTGRRIPLPTYPFERQRYRVAATAPATLARGGPKGKNVEISNWFYAPSWKRSPSLGPGSVGDNKLPQHWLIFDDGSSLSSRLVERLKETNAKVTRVRIGTRFGSGEDGAYSIAPEQPDDYEALLRRVEEKDGIPDVIVHCWSLTEEKIEGGEVYFEQAQTMGFDSLMYLAQGLGSLKSTRPLQLCVITNRLFEIESTDRTLPEKATLLGPCKVIPQENSHITCRCLDVAIPQSGNAQERLVEQILSEIVNDSLEVTCGYRGPHRWAPHYAPVRLDDDRLPVRSLREQGVYLITGALGRVGLILTEYLARTVRARLILTGRSEFPRKEYWRTWVNEHGPDDRVSRIISKLQQAEELGAELLVVSADVADETQMQAVIKQGLERFGAIHGVIHAAGITTGPLKPVAATTREETRRTFQPKVNGVYLLDKLFSGSKIDFGLLLSSNAAVFGGLGMVDYAASNIFMDAFASNRSKEDGSVWISANWDPWPDETRQEQERHSSLEQYRMTAEESAEAFRRVVSAVPGGQVIVATGDFEERLDLWVQRTSTRQRAGATAAATAPIAYPRPLFGKKYEAPRNELEEVVANIWRELLGYEQVGVHDNFFELGGHSLVALQVVSRINERLNIEMSLAMIFSSPTVEKLSEAIDDILLKEIEELSEVEAQRQLDAIP